MSMVCVLIWRLKGKVYRYDTAQFGGTQCPKGGECVKRFHVLAFMLV